MTRSRLLKAHLVRLQSVRNSTTRFHHVSPCYRNVEIEPPLPSITPKIALDIKHIRNDPELHRQNCLDRNYAAGADAPQKIIELSAQWYKHQQEGRSLRERNNQLKIKLSDPAAFKRDTDEARQVETLSKEQIIEEARSLKERISAIAEREDVIKAEIDSLAASLPNITSHETPRGDVAGVLGYINDPSTIHKPSTSHVEIGTRLGILDFESAVLTSGWGFYSFLNQGALLEQALLSYAQSVCLSHGWSLVTPPSMVYSHIASACGFQARDQGRESQIYKISQQTVEAGRRPEYCLAGTAEIPLAGMKADKTIPEEQLPLKLVAASRCYRREAGGRGRGTKGLYRVHEFSKLELFAWTHPSYARSLAVFDEMLNIQTTILTSLGLHCRILEMPSTDLGASAMRKKDIEAWFPSRVVQNVHSNAPDGWGEVTSTSICGDYQSRRLGTRTTLKNEGAKRTTWVWTVNGTALAVPRVWAALVECGWDAQAGVVRLPEVLWPYMGGRKVIEAEK